ncbi:hypothetical protein ACKW6Q_09230 [Chryseobacterium kwangjuense]|uniref:Uncharacterized protein n=1 Tax=Chryseobacterium kwangjuense TaxID=267125 RepID=A0ABW9K1F2_9FLAO
MGRKKLLYLISAFAVAGLILFLFIYSPKNENKFILADIKVEIKGKIKKKVAVRKNLFTHTLISRFNKTDTLIFLGESIDSVNVGDNFLKYKDSPFFYVLKQEKKVKKLKYVSIPKSILTDENFSKEWKDSCKTAWRSVVVDN